MLYFFLSETFVDAEVSGLSVLACTGVSGLGLLPEPPSSADTSPGGRCAWAWSPRASRLGLSRVSGHLCWRCSWSLEISQSYCFRAVFSLPISLAPQLPACSAAGDIAQAPASPRLSQASVLLAAGGASPLTPGSLTSVPSTRAACCSFHPGGLCCPREASLPGTPA